MKQQGTLLHFMIITYKLFINNVYQDFETLLSKAIETDNWEEVQEYVVNNTQGHLTWMTGIGIMDAVDLIIKESIANGNIEIVNS